MLVSPHREYGDVEPVGYRPLYRQVRDLLVKRIVERTWQPGQMIPSEPEIAQDLGVSQGTVRKALDEMTAENLLVRRQGRGTFVARHDEERVLFQFFKLARDDGAHRFPESNVFSVTREEADAEASEALELDEGDPIVRIGRVRSLDGMPRIVERIVLPARHFPGLEQRELPNNLYDMYATRFGVVIARGADRLKAVAASEEDAKRLQVAPGSPLLAVDRVAVTIDGRRAEWRVALCRTDTFHYRCDLR